MVSHAWPASRCGTLEAAFSHLVRADWIVPSGGRYRFAEPIEREEILAKMSARRRRRGHLAVARALRELESRRGRRPSFRRAFHLQRGGGPRGAPLDPARHAASVWRAQGTPTAWRRWPAGGWRPSTSRRRPRGTSTRCSWRRSPGPPIDWASEPSSERRSRGSRSSTWTSSGAPRRGPGSTFSTRASPSAGASSGSPGGCCATPRGSRTARRARALEHTTTAPSWSWTGRRSPASPGGSRSSSVTSTRPVGGRGRRRTWLRTRSPAPRRAFLTP